MEDTEGRSTTNDFVEPVLSDIRSTWNIVRPGIESILADNPSLTFIPEDVYSDCVNERAFLFTSPVGFLVLTIEIDRYTKDKTLYMWIAYTYEKGGHEWLAHQDWIEDLARKSDCKYIEAQSHVPELEPYAIAKGWHTDTRIYRRTVKSE
tara:strand:+ start:200 stop:649 length:450 start_codon:yes stop_codon:yes gene_type:complete